jgi:uncharacterized protein
MTRRTSRLLLIAAAFLVGLAAAQPPSYLASIERWRTDHEAGLRADDGWLTVVGLAWLKEGPNRAGSAEGSDVRLPAAAPAALGVFTLAAGRVTFEPAAGAAAALNGKPASAQLIRPDADRITTASVTLLLIKRGDRYGIRIRDRESAARRAFAGESWYPASESWRITARFEPYVPPKMLPILNVLGQVELQPSPGAAVFTLGGKEYRLDPIGQGRQLFFIFRDATSGDTTYPAGRFLYSPAPRDGQVVLDFNRAENPPCAFTEFATCPLPPKQNQLPIRVDAGEKYRK